MKYRRIPLLSRGMVRQGHDLLAGMALVYAVASVGCSSQLAPPDRHAPEDAARRALETYDTDQNGQLSGGEIEQSPALASAMDRIDSNNDGKLSSAEIAERLKAYDTQASTVPLSVRVRLGTRPLEMATVEFVQEEFTVAEPKAYSGTSDSLGAVSLATEGKSVGGLPVGLYRVTITRAGGEEYVRGVEVAEDSPDGTRIVFSL